MAFPAVWLKKTVVLTVAHERRREGRREEHRMRGRERDTWRCLECKQRRSLQNTNSCSFPTGGRRRSVDNCGGLMGKGLERNNVRAAERGITKGWTVVDLNCDPGQRECCNSNKCKKIWLGCTPAMWDY